MDLALRASHYVDPVTFELRRDVLLLIDKGRVVETILGAEVSGGLTGLAKESLDYEAALVLPGFVNAHCHLDLSHLAGQLPSGLAFTEWIDCIIEGRKVPHSQIQAAIDGACDQLLATGTTSVIDISVDGSSFAALTRRGISGAVCLEVLGIDPEKATAAMERADAVIRSIEGEAEKFYAGSVGAPSKAQLRSGFRPMRPIQLPASSINRPLVARQAKAASSRRMWLKRLMSSSSFASHRDPSATSMSGARSRWLALRVSIKALSRSCSGSGLRPGSLSSRLTRG